MKIKQRLLLALMLVFLGEFFFAFNHVEAQTETTVFLLPDPATVYLNGSNNQVVEVWVGDVVELNAFDITVDYDPTVANLVSWSRGNFLELSGGGCFQHPMYPIAPGHFQIICNQLAKEPKTGSGVLLRLTFSGLSFDSTDLTITNPSFALTDDNYMFYPTPIDGILNATFDPGIIKPVNLNGTVSMQGRTNQSGANIRLAGQVVGNSYSGTSSNASGNNYVFNNIAMDLYTVWTNTPAYLNVPVSMNKQIGLVAAATTLNPLHLVAGNAVWSDNEIDVHDFSLVAGNYGKANFNSAADINGDGKVDAFDLALVAGNYGKTSEEEYAGWQP